MLSKVAIKRHCVDLSEQAVNKHKGSPLTPEQFLQIAKEDEFNGVVNKTIRLVYKNTLKNKSISEQKKLIKTAWNHRQGLDVYGLEAVSRIYTKLFGVKPHES